MKEGKIREAVMYFQTPEVRGHQPCIVADSQLAFLYMAGLADIVITVDIDLTLFG